MAKKIPAVRVFVYGTLKDGFSLSGWMDRSRLVCADAVSGYTLISLGPYPALLRLPGLLEYKVAGEVYDMPAAAFSVLAEMEESVGYTTFDAVTDTGLSVKLFVFKDVVPGTTSWTEQVVGDKAVGAVVNQPKLDELSL